MHHEHELCGFLVLSGTCRFFPDTYDVSGFKMLSRKAKPNLQNLMRNNMEATTLVKQLSELLGAHDVPYHIKDEWIVPYGRLPAIRATWFPREHNGVLEVEILLESEKIINECFAGIGVGNEGITDALQNFCVNSLHVLLAAFWERNYPEQVTTEVWSIYSKPYTVYIGNFGTRGSDGISPEIPHDLFETIEHTIKNEPLNEEIYWFRSFFCNLSGEQTFEALKNNDIWESGLRSLKSLTWKRSEGYYSVRNFLVLKATASL